MILTRRSLIPRSADPLWRGLVAWYPLWDRSGKVAHDVAGRLNNLTITGPAWDSMRQGTALQFDGTNDLAKRTGFRPSFDHSAPNPATEISIVAWVQAASTSTGGSQDYVIALPESGTIGDELNGVDLRQTDGQWFFDLVTEGTPGGSFNAAGAVTTSPTHLGLVHDGTTLKGYQDGDEILSTVVALGTGYRQNSGAVSLGNFGDGSLFWAGKLCDVRIYNRALSASEVRKIMYDPVSLARGFPFAPVSAGVLPLIQHHRRQLGMI